MSNLRRVLALAFGVCMLASCGGSSYKGLTKPDFVKQANAICKGYDTKVSAAVSSSGVSDSSTQEQQVALVEGKIVPLIRQEVSDIRKLKPPKADRTQVKKILDDVSASVDDAEHELKNTPKNALGSSFDPFTQADKEATAYGLTDCTSSSPG